MIWTGLLMMSGTGALADQLPPPAGEPILRVDGLVAHANADGALLFDLAMLDALPQETFTTTTIWSDGALTFSGPPLAAVLQAAGASGTRLRARALNDYSVEIPVAEIGPRFPILATRIDGQTFGVRDKGPIWIIYPYDSGAIWRTEVNFGRSVWQLAALTLEE
ncbi:MAG TPA: oxidoreductase [Paracoccaceae bacterium]|nr:oxidoreductase [Paracoccaceae bacterium]